jgi:hypothetical protein
MEITKFLDASFPDKKTRNPTDIRQEIYKHGIMSSYESPPYEKSSELDDSVEHKDVKDETTVFQGRMIFYGSKNQRMINSQTLQLECNGLVIDTKTWKPVVISPLLFRSNVQTNVVNVHLVNDLYDMMPVSDGTVVSFYYWEPLNQWRIATSRGYDMTECKWGSKTYLELWGEICDSYGYKSTSEFFETLDKTRSYTFGFKHEDIHPFCEDIHMKTDTRKAWFIQSASLTDFEDVVYEYESMIPNQVLFEAPDNTRPIYKSLNKALLEFLDHDKINFGYILRSRNPSKTGGHSHIMYESSLMQQIRQLYYHSDFYRDANALGYDRETYTVVYSYLDPNRNSMFIRLFPQHATAFENLTDITADIIKDIINYAKNPIAYTEDNSIIKKNIMTLYHSMSHDFTINPNDKHIVKILMSYLLDPRWVNLYYDIYRTDILSTALNAM